MMWVVRAGKSSVYYEKYLSTRRIFIPWDGFCVDLSSFKSVSEYRTLVAKEKDTHNRTSISNWAGQLYSFVWEMKSADFVLIPSKLSQTYTLARVTGNYAFDQDEEDRLYHSRTVELIVSEIPKKIMSRELVYSLGAYRTVFKVKHEDDVLKTIDKWKEQRVNG